MRRRNGWGRTSLKEFSSEHLQAQINRLLLNRMAMLAPFPYQGKEIYDAVWTARDKEAIEYIADNLPGLLKYDDDFRLYLTESACTYITPGGYKYTHMLVEVGSMVPLPQDDWRAAQAGSRTPRRHMGMLPEHMQSAIREWLDVFGRLNGETNDTIVACRDVFGACNTFGQIVRLWPSLKSFMPEEAMVKIRDQKIQSKLPDSVFVEGTEKVLKPEFQPDRFSKFDSIIAEALILPCDLKVDQTPKWTALPSQ